MSVRCPDCGAVAGYGYEIGHKSNCPSLKTKPASAWERRPSETEDQWRGRCRHYEFMAFDPDNPDVPLD